MESLYGNVGHKLKVMACVIFVILSLGSVVFGFANMVTDDILNMGDEIGIIVGLLCIILGPIFAFCSSLALYGFGELIENSSYLPEIKRSLKPANSTTTETSTKVTNAENTTPTEEKEHLKKTKYVILVNYPQNYHQISLRKQDLSKY